MNTLARLLVLSVALYAGIGDARAADGDTCSDVVDVTLFVDTDTGTAYTYDDFGRLIQTTEVQTATVPDVLVDMTFLEGEWDVEVQPEDGPSAIHPTRDGRVRFLIDATAGPHLVVPDLSRPGGGQHLPSAPTVPVEPAPTCPTSS